MARQSRQKSTKLTNGRGAVLIVKWLSNLQTHHASGRGKTSVGQAGCERKLRLLAAQGKRPRPHTKNSRACMRAHGADGERGRPDQVDRPAGCLRAAMGSSSSASDGGTVAVVADGDERL